MLLFIDAQRIFFRSQIISASATIITSFLLLPSQFFADMNLPLEYLLPTSFGWLIETDLRESWVEKCIPSSNDTTAIIWPIRQQGSIIYLFALAFEPFL